jgi:Putative lumazine-binding
MNDYQQILELLHTYGHSVFNGDVERLRSTFHPQAALFGEVKGAPYYRTLDDYLNAVAQRKSPRDVGETFAMKPLAIEVQGPVGSARMHSPMLGYNYIDFLNLVRLDGRWVISNKTFTHVDA